MDLHVGKLVSGLRRLALIVVLAGAVCAPFSAQGVVLDWDMVSWTPGSLSQSYDLDASNEGNDVTITISGNTSRIKQDYPKIEHNVTGGISPDPESLQFFVDFATRSEQITVTVTFHYAQGVEQAAFTLFDLDKKNDNTFVDQVRDVRARFGTESDLGAAITGSPRNTVAGSGTTQTITGTGESGDSSGDANAAISFGANRITEFSFTFGNSSAANAGPKEQNFALHDISFSRVIPEVNPGLGALAVCGLAVGLRYLWSVRRLWKTVSARPTSDRG